MIVHEMKKADFKYGMGFPLKEIQVDTDKARAICAMKEAFAFSILGFCRVRLDCHSKLPH